MNPRLPAVPAALASLLALALGAAPAASGPLPGTGDECDPPPSADRGGAGGKGQDDCNDNGIPDACDIQNGTSQDCNQDGIPDECLVCPPLDIVFVFDTSGSMTDESVALCNVIGQVEADLADLGIMASSTILGITQGSSPSFPCLMGSVAATIGTDVPGTGDSLNSSEDWGPATAVVAQGFGWIPGSVRVVVPISDEGAENGNPCSDPGGDRDAVDNAIQVAQANNVIVSPIGGTGSSQCVITLMTDMADATGGTFFLSTDPDTDLAQALFDLAVAACEQASDCNQNGIPDECEPDCNGNGIPDDCDGGCGGEDLFCEEFDRYEDLTADDTLTVITNFHNPETEQGYVYVYAVDESNQAIGFDYLIGNQLVVQGLEAFEYSVNPVDYRAAVDEGLITDLDGDGVRDLNGAEYEWTAGEILVPRFLGQLPNTTQSELILIALSGGREFTTSADFLIYNDNEVAFSAEHSFYCWDKVPLLEISGAFSNAFLANGSGDDPDESVGNRESGWFRLSGGVAYSSTTALQDPAVYGVYVERVGSYGAADLPFETCLQSGHLLPRELGGDNEEVDGAPSDQTCDEHIGRRKPGSLLLYPEFDNRAGVVTILTVTNSSAEDGTRVHYRYVGRFGN